MFTLQTQWDRPNKISSQTSEHILRLRMIPKPETRHRTLPLRIAIALDTSQSMEGEKLESAKQACNTVVQQLRAEDRISLASFSTEVNPLLQNLEGNDQSSAKSAIALLYPGGVTRTDLALKWFAQALPYEKGTARVAILITDGHATNNRGYLLDDLDPLLAQANQLAKAGIIVCTVGLGNANNFNTGFLGDLSDRGQGAFIYADTPDQLTPQLYEQLINSQTIIAEEVTFRFQPEAGVTLQGFCQISPEYRPLEETAPNQISLSGVKGGDRPTDILVAVKASPLSSSQSISRQNLLKLDVKADDLPSVTETVSINHTQSYREAQQVDESVNRDRLLWVMNQCSTELTHSQDPQKTGELLVDLQVAATKCGQSNIAQTASQQLQALEKSGRLDPHKSALLFQNTRNLRGK